MRLPQNAFHREGMALVTQKRVESLRQSHLGQVKGNLEVRTVIASVVLRHAVQVVDGLHLSTETTPLQFSSQKSGSRPSSGNTARRVARIA